MLIIGLTGGIGSGKSTVAARFAQQGVPVVDTDRLARDLVEPGQPALDDIVATFGRGFIDAHGRLDRARLRGHVFTDTRARRQLEALLHPRIRVAVMDWLHTQDAPYVIMEVPLLLEGNLADLVDRILLVDATQADQRARTCARDGLTRAQFDAILGTQASRDERLAAADDIIDNQGPVSALIARIVELHRHYTALAGQDHRPGR